MSDAIELAGRPPGLRFVARWIGVAALAVAISVSTIATFGVLAAENKSDESFYYLAGVAVLSLPLLCALGYSWTLRRTIRRPILWGILTGSGIVFAAASLLISAFTLEDLWLPITEQTAAWIARSVHLRVPPLTFVTYAGSGVLFGLVLGTTQAVALDSGWGDRMRWTAASGTAGLIAGISAYLYLEVDAVANGLLDDIAGFIPLPGDWPAVPLAVLVALLLCVSFTLPTGLFMQRLLRRHRRADDEALLRRFE
jgi:hypothetical protein